MFIYSAVQGVNGKVEVKTFTCNNLKQIISSFPLRSCEFITNYNNKNADFVKILNNAAEYFNESYVVILVKKLCLNKRKIKGIYNFSSDIHEKTQIVFLRTIING